MIREIATGATAARVRTRVKFAISGPLRARAHRVLSLVSEHSKDIISLAQTFVSLQREPSQLNKLGIAASLTAMLAAKLVTPLPSAYDEFKVSMSEGSVDLQEMLEAHVVPWPTRFDAWPNLKMASIEGVDVLINRDVSRHVVVRTVDEVQRLRDILAAGVWREHGTVVQTIGASHDGHSDSVLFAPVVWEPVQPSAKAEAVWARVAPFVAAGRPRSVLLDGRPGTGKSTIARWLAMHVGGRVLVISASSVDRMTPESLESAVAWLRPDVVLIDDFDRVSTHGGMLTAIEHVRLLVKLFVVTTNNLKLMDAAAVRPQRFDEYFTIDSLGEPFVRKYLSNVWDALSQEDKATVLPWPVTYLEELVERATYVSDVVLADEVAQLQARLAEHETPEWARRLTDHSSCDPSASTPGETSTIPCPSRSGAPKHATPAEISRGCRAGARTRSVDDGPQRRQRCRQGVAS